MNNQPNLASKDRKKITFLLIEDSYILDFTGPLQVFESANILLGKKYYDFNFISTGTNDFIRLGSTKVICDDNIYNASFISSDTLIIPGGPRAIEQSNDKGIINWLKQNAYNFNRIVSVCTASFILAKAGLLKDSPATTHWLFVDDLKKSHPDLNIIQDCRYTEDKNERIYTSAGVSKGIDLALLLIKKDLGEELSEEVARHIMINQTQATENLYSPAKVSELSLRMQKIIHWIESNIQENITIENLSSTVGLSRRQLTRVFKEELNMSPSEYVDYYKFKLAENKLRFSNLSLFEIAKTCGYNSVEQLRRSFKSRAGLSPLEFRKLSKNAG